MSTEILIIDDNPDIRVILNELIQDAGYRTRLAANYNQALSEIDKKLPEVAIIDVKLDKGDNDGIELLSHIKKKNKDIPVIIISGHANIEMAIKSLKNGAFEFIEKPFDQNRLLNFVNRAVENFNLKNQNKELETKLFHSFDLVGKSPNILKIKEQIEKLSNSDSRVFIFGPTGSGKELIARKIHKMSKRSKSPFVILNGALLDVKKYEQELFGEEKNNGSISYGALEKATGGIYNLINPDGVQDYRIKKIRKAGELEAVKAEVLREIQRQDMLAQIEMRQKLKDIDDQNRLITGGF